MASIARYIAWVSVFCHRERTYGDERVTRGVEEGPSLSLGCCVPFPCAE